MTAGWRTVRVFISSTFRDMQAERDHLVKVVFPALRERLEPFRVHLIDIDLRWGVTREQAENNRAVELCLRLAGECDVFLGLLGQRYGWVPDSLPPGLADAFPWVTGHARKSITELEVLHAALNETGRRRAGFFFRDPGATAAVPEAVRPTYAEDDPGTAQKLEALKDRIRDSGLPVTVYPARWDGASRFAGLERFGEEVRDRLWADIHSMLRLPDAPAVGVGSDGLAEEADHHERFMESRLRVYVGREPLHLALLSFSDGHTASPCLVVGPSGAGKSAVLARFVTEYRRRGSQPLVVAHFVGASPRSTSLREMLSRFCHSLKGRFGFAEDIPAEATPLAITFRKFLSRVPARARVLIVIDALNQLDEADRARDLDWLPAQLPPNVKVVASCLADEGEPALAAFSRRPHQVLAVEPLGDEERREIIRAVPSLSAKALDAEQVRLLLDNPATSNPLFLLVALEELRGFGSYEQLNERIRAFPRAGDTVTALFHQVLDRLEREFDRTTVVSTLSLLAVARRGLFERELQEMLAGAEDLFPILRQLRPYLLSRGGLLDFYHQNLARAIGERYLRTAEERHAVHTRIAGYFQGQPSFFPAARVANARKADELPFHLLESRQAEVCARLLMELPFLEAKVESGLLFELARDLLTTAQALPAGHPQRPVLQLLEEAVRTDLHFLARHPSALFQCLWNRLWWYDSPEAARYYHTPTRATPPWDQPGEKLSRLVETWRAQKEQEGPGFLWLQSLRPPEVHLGTAQRAVFRGHGGEVTGVAFSPDGLRLATASADQTARLWDVASGAELHCLHGHRERVWAVAFTPDGLLVSGSWDKSVRLWDAQGGELRHLRGHRNRVWSVAVSPDGRLIAGGADDMMVRVWDARTGERIARMWGEGGPVWSVAFSPDGNTIAAGMDDHTIRLWDWQTRKEVGRLRGHTEEVMGVAFTPDGRRLVSGSGDGTVRVWDIAARREVRVLTGHEGWVAGVAVSPDGTRAASGSWDATVRVWDLDAGAETACLAGHQGPVWGVAFSPDGRLVASAGGDWTARIWDAVGGHQVLRLRGHDHLLEDFAFAPDGMRLVSCSFDRTVRTWDTGTGLEERCLVGHEGFVRGVAVSPDGRRIASASEDATVRLWDADTGAEVARLRGHEMGGAAWEVAFSPDGTRLVTGGDDRVVRIWDVKTGAVVQRLRGHEHWICAVAYSPAGKTVASASGDRTVKVWEVESGAVLASLDRASIIVTRMAFTADGDRLWCGVTDGTVRVWDWRRGDCATVMEGLRDVAALALGTHAWAATAREGEAEVYSTADGVAQAWFPATLKRLAAHPGGRLWAGTFRNHLYLFRLEGVEPGAESE